MNILLLSFSYPPEIGPGSFRAQTIAKALTQFGPSDLHIDVITTYPLRYDPQKPIPQIEQHGNITIYRINAPFRKNNFIFQVLTFFYFAFCTLFQVRHKKYDSIVTTSGRLATAALASLIAKVKSAKLYVDIREIFPENIKGLFPGVRGQIMSQFFSIIESRVVQQANKVNLISPGFLDYYQSKFKQSFSCYMHAVDPLFIGQFQEATSAPNARLKVYYAGNLGYGQSLDQILPSLAKKTANQLDFYIVGGGNRLELLRTALQEQNITNVTLMNSMSREKLIRAYQNADILFLHIHPYPFTLRVLPSKIFEYAATGKPIWAGVMGYARTFMEQEVSNCAIFTPDNVDDAISAFHTLTLRTLPRTEFLQHHNQEKLMRMIASDILSL